MDKEKHQSAPEIREGKVAAVGTFDGVHRGHRAVLERLRDYARENGLTPLAITFKEHPLKVIDPTRVPGTLTPLDKKKKLLIEAGANPLPIDFDRSLMNVTAKEWMKNLRDDNAVEAMVVGYDNTFGCDGITLSLEDYRNIGKELGIEIISAPEIKNVSSSAIRKAVAEGKMEEAAEMLGRPYSITSKVKPGNSLGHTIGFPTANIYPEEGIAIPKPGVYAAIVKTLDDGKKHKAMVNVGHRPTVMRGEDLVIEAHLLDWNGNLYDRDITVRFLKRMRDEKKFESIEALKQQLRLDSDYVKNLEI